MVVIVCLLILHLHMRSPSLHILSIMSVLCSKITMKMHQ
jgi:hypothetical protein